MPFSILLQGVEQIRRSMDAFSSPARGVVVAGNMMSSGKRNWKSHMLAPLSQGLHKSGAGAGLVETGSTGGNTNTTDTTTTASSGGDDVDSALSSPTQSGRKAKIGGTRKSRKRRIPVVSPENVDIVWENPLWDLHSPQPQQTEGSVDTTVSRQSGGVFFFVMEWSGVA